MADVNNTTDRPPEDDSYLPSALEGNEVFGEGEEAEFNDILSDASRYQTTGTEDDYGSESEEVEERIPTESSHQEKTRDPVPEAQTTTESTSSEDEGGTPSEWTERERKLLQLLEQAGGAVLGGNRQQSDETEINISETHDFIGDLELDDLLDTKEGLNSLLNKVYQAGVEASARSVMQRVPEVVNSRIERHQNLNRIAEDFYSANPDLSEMKQTVAIVTQEILNREPNIPMGELLERAGTQTRSLLGMRAPQRTNTTSRTGSRNPGFVNGSTARQPRQSDNRTEFQKEIDEMLNL